MTDLTIDMVEDLTPAKKRARKPSPDERGSDRAPDPEGAPLRNERLGGGGTETGGMLERLLSHARAAHSDNPEDPPFGREGRRNEGGAADDRAPMTADAPESGGAPSDSASAPASAGPSDADEDDSRDAGASGGADRPSGADEDDGYDPLFDEANYFGEDEEEFEELARCLDACPSFSFRYHEGFGGWVAPSASPGRSCRILCTPLRIGTARVEIDTGYRVRRGRIRDANLFAMMDNGILRLRGFERIGHDGAVRFAYASSCDDPVRFERRLILALACCEEAIRLFSLVSLGTSPAKALAIYTGDYDEMDDLEFETAYGADFDPQPRDEDDE